jgi:hypothetical protein
VTAPAAPPPEYSRPGTAQPSAENPRSRGHSPARDARQQAPEPAERKIKLGDSEYAEGDVRTALAHKVEADTRKAALPKSPDGYELKLPANFQAPEGLRFEPNAADPLYQLAREQAFRRGLDQETFSEMYGVFAAAKIAELQQANQNRENHLKALGSAAPRRIEAVATWLKAVAGKDGAQVGEFIRRYPSSNFVTAFEKVMRQMSDQGGAAFNQSGRSEQANPGTIPGYENMTYLERRAAQDRAAQAAQRRSR